MDLVTYALSKGAAKKYTDNKVAGIGAGFSYKGSVATIADLPASATKGDEYTVGTLGAYVWDGSAWAKVAEKGQKGDTGETGAPGQQGIPGRIYDVTMNGVSVYDSSDSTAKLTTVQNLTSATSTEPLAASQGKILNDRINNLQNIGRFLAIWNAATGLPATNPPEMPYTYKTGDYYRVGTISQSTNYKPNGSSYDGTASTTEESETITEGSVYYFDGTTWKLQTSGGGGTVLDVQIDGTSILSGGVADFDSEAFTFTLANGTTVTKNILVKE